jgi:2Fe-2S ferredoxin
MPIVTVIDAHGIEHQREVMVGESLMQSLSEQGFVDAVCGGAMSCGTCAIAFDALGCALLPPPDELELALLEGLGCSVPEQRLSCQVSVSEAMDGMVVRVLSTLV